MGQDELLGFDGDHDGGVLHDAVDGVPVDVSSLTLASLVAISSTVSAYIFYRDFIQAGDFNCMDLFLLIFVLSCGH